MPGLAGSPRGLTIPETWEERIFRETRMGRYCRYCEEHFIAAKDNQRFHNNRCGVLYAAGRIADATFERWQHGPGHNLGELHLWNDGVIYPADSHIRPYYEPQRTTHYDWARRQVYWAIVEIPKRASISAPADALRAYKLLSEGLLKIMTLGLKLHGPYYTGSQEEEDEGRVFPRDESDWSMHVTECKAKGFAALQEVAEFFDARFRRVMLSGNPMPDMHWLEV